jgi:hypothetical protein
MKTSAFPASGLSCLGIAAVLGACLPDDTRDPPGELVALVRADESLSDGAPSLTADGWSLVIERFLVVLGQVRLDGDACEVYSSAGYDRIFDALRPEPQRVSVSHALGRCGVGFGISSPAWDTLRGSGVTASDEAMLRTAGTDAHSGGGGISVHLEGSAGRHGVTKRFAWSFRRFITYDACHLSEQRPESSVALTGGRRSDVTIALRADQLFQDDLDGPRSLRFEPFRDADELFGDANGTVTLDELDRTPLPTDPPSTLGERVYVRLLPSVAAYRGTGSCVVATSSKRPGGFGGP